MKLRSTQLNITHTVYILIEGVIKELFWFKVGKDGSIYIGSKEPKPKYIFFPDYKSLEKGKLENFKNGISGAAFTKLERFNTNKYSFHPSGNINFDLNKNTRRPSFWSISKKEHLVTIIFRDLRNMQDTPPDNVKKGYIMIKGYLPEPKMKLDQTLTCNLSLASYLEDSVDLTGKKSSFGLCLKYANFEDTRKKPMGLHFLFTSHKIKPNNHMYFLYPYINLA